MRRLILKSFQSPGDILMLTAAVRDLHQAYPSQYQTDVRTSADALWLNNPLITRLEDRGPGVETIDMHYPLVHQSNQRPYHFLHGYVQYLEQQLKVRIPLTRFQGDVYLSAEEKAAPPPGTEHGLPERFWIVIAGGKYDFTAKWWNPASYQKVVDHFRGRIQFAQCGEQGHWHPKLNGVIDLIGMTSVRDFVRLMYHAEGVLCPITFAMHLAAAVETKPGRPKKRACVVVAGGREPPHWEAYPTHQFISTVGTLPCCAEGGCWKSRCQLVGDGDQKDTRDLCDRPVQVAADLRIPQCMEMIQPEDVIRRIELYLVADASANGVAHKVTPSAAITSQAAAKEVVVTPAPINGKPSPIRGPKMNVLIQFNHGLGDAVQLTIVLQHLRKLRPDWEIDVRCLRGKHTALRGLCRRVYHDQEPAPNKSAYQAHYDLGWYECYSAFSDSPSTKACNCLREIFKITPIPELCSYEINPEKDDFAITAAYLESIGCRRGDNNRYNAVVLHYQGNTSAHKKNLDHHTANAVCQETIAAGYVPVVLDWDHRSPLPDGKTIFCPAVQKPDIWGDFGSGDAVRIAALVAQSSLFIGIDSGPAKAAAATDTPNICVWTGHHPIQFHDLTKTHHLVPDDHRSLPPATNPTAAGYFVNNYDFSTYPIGKLTEKLCETLCRFLGKNEPAATVAQDGLTKFIDFWCHADRVEQDWTIIEDVFVKDCYRLSLLDPSMLGNVVDVGAHIGTFARLVKKTNSSARVVCLEVAPENIEPLRRNVEGIADAVHACVVGEKTGAVKLLNSFTDASVSRSTGGSTIVPVAKQSPRNSEYRTEEIECERLTLKQVMARYQMQHIDLLKLDCEGSEYDILQDAPLDRIRFILGEYHGFDRWEDFRARVFPGWDYGHMQRVGDMGNFHLRNPFFDSRPAETSQPPVPCSTQNLVHRQGFWVRADNVEQDLVIVRDIVKGDSYRTSLLDGAAFDVVVDVGAHIGTFARLWHHKNPKAKIVCVEACPENIPALIKNVGDFATVIHAACSYSKEPLALLNAVRPNCESTGGSTVVPAKQLSTATGQAGYSFWKDSRPLKSITLEQIMARLGVDHIDLLKLDCEGSEYDILENTTSRERIRFILGEYHGLSRWNEFRGWVLSGWDYGHMSQSSDLLGVFHLANRKWPPRAKEQKILRVAVPSGIGDILWVLTKIPALLAAEGADKVDIDICRSSYPRSAEFVNAFDFVRNVNYCEFECVEASPSTTPDGCWNYAPSQPRWHDRYGWLLQANGHLEKGKRLEEWLPHLDTDWRIAERFHFTSHEEAMAEAYVREVSGPFAVFYASSEPGNTIYGHNRGPLWSPNEWARLCNLFLASGVTPVFVGAEWDRSYFERYLQPILPHGVLNKIGDWPIGVTFAVIRRSRCVIAYQSGLGIFAVYMGVPTAMWWRPYGNSIHPQLHVTFREEMAHAWAPPGAVDSGQYLPCIYTKSSAESICAHAKKHWLIQTEVPRVHARVATAITT